MTKKDLMRKAAIQEAEIIASALELLALQVETTDKVANDKRAALAKMVRAIAKKFERGGGHAQ